jgi:flavodoxin
VNIAIVYHSTTGTTAKAAEAMGKQLEGLGHLCQVQTVFQADPAEVATADLIFVGTWVRGWFIVRQHPTHESMYFIKQLGDLSGKNVVVFCTYKLAVGSTLDQMAKALEGKGANIVGQFKYRGSDPNQAFVSFAESLA